MYTNKCKRNRWTMVGWMSLVAIVVSVAIAMFIEVQQANAVDVEPCIVSCIDSIEPTLHDDAEGGTQVAQHTSGIELSEPDNPYNVQYDRYGNEYPLIQWSMDLSERDKYYLAKIIECEAGICDMETKIRHGLSILNRVHSDRFPNTVYDVITQNNGKVWQYSPCMPGGSWYRVEPGNESYQAVEYIASMDYDISYGATFFEATGSDSVWHQKALKQVCESDGVRFYAIP